MRHTHNDCPIAQTAKLIGDTWVILVMRDLLVRPARFCELERSLNGISTRTLTIKLKLLEAEGFITKKELYYSTTTKGKALASMIKTLESFGKKYF